MASPSSLNYPGLCRYGHSEPVPIHDPPSFLAHHVSFHNGTPFSLVAASFISTSPTSAPASVKPQSDPCSSFGVLLPRVLAKKSSSSGSGSNFTPEEIAAFARSLGRHISPDATLDLSDFFAELYIYFANHLGTNKTENTGPVVLRDENQPDHLYKQLTWHAVTLEAKQFFSQSGREFTWRKCLLALGPMFRVFRDSNAPCFHTLSQLGTRNSRRWKMADGSLAPYWIFIPEIFNDDLTPEHDKVLKLYWESRNTGTLEQNASHRGLDSDGSYAQAEHNTVQHVTRSAQYSHATSKTQQTATKTPPNAVISF